jgi:hypothetical protein
VGEKNKEIIRLIGRRLREATAAAEAELPTSIVSGLERLSELAPGGNANGQLQLHPQVEAAAQPAGE